MGGGIAINNSNCSTAATATIGIYEVLLTAGHCLGNIGATTRQNTAIVGEVLDKIYGNGTYDAGAIKLTNTSKTIGNGFYGSNSPTNEYTLSYSATQSPTSGQLICKSGIKTNITCGNVVSTSTSVYYKNDKITLSGMIKAERSISSMSCKKDPPDGLSCPGDSGSTMYNATNTSRIIGITSGNDGEEGQYGYFTKITDALSGLDALLYKSSKPKAVDPTK